MQTGKRCTPLLGCTNNPLFALDARAYDLWALGAELPAGMMFTQAVEIV